MAWFNDHSMAENDRGCATEHCHGRAVWRLDVDGISSLYCTDCKDRIDGLEPPLSEAKTINELARIVALLDDALHRSADLHGFLSAMREQAHRVIARMPAEKDR